MVLVAVKTKLQRTMQFTIKTILYHLAGFTAPLSFLTLRSMIYTLKGE